MSLFTIKDQKKKKILIIYLVILPFSFKPLKLRWVNFRSNNKQPAPWLPPFHSLRCTLGKERRGKSKYSTKANVKELCVPKI